MQGMRGYVLRGHAHKVMGKTQCVDRNIQVFEAICTVGSCTLRRLRTDTHSLVDMPILDIAINALCEQHCVT